MRCLLWLIAFDQAAEAYGLSPREKLKHRLKSAIRLRGPPHPRGGLFFTRRFLISHPNPPLRRVKLTDSVPTRFSVLAVCFHSLQLGFFLEWGYEYRVPLTSRMNNRLYYGNWSYLQSGVVFKSAIIIAVVIWNDNHDLRRDFRSLDQWHSSTSGWLANLHGFNNHVILQTPGPKNLVSGLSTDLRILWVGYQRT